LGITAGVLAMAGTANADVYCVNDPACPAGGLPRSTPEAALADADYDVPHDTVRIGPGTYKTTGLSASMPVDIVGAGRAATTIVETDVGAAIHLQGASLSVSNLTVRIPEPGSQGITLALGADADNVEVEAPDSAANTLGVLLTDPGSVLEHVIVDLPDDVGQGVYSAAGGAVRDSTIAAGTGLNSQGPTLSVRRTVVRASLGLFAYGGSINASNVLITRHPRPIAGNFKGVWIQNDYNGITGSLLASNLTIDGRDKSGGVGIQVSADHDPVVATGTATASVTGAIVRGVQTPLKQDGDSPTETATLNTAYSSYDGSAAQGNQFGALNQGAGNHTNDPDPRFVDPAGLDYRLRWDSPLLDQGRPAPFLTAENPDLAGHERVRDSDGNGSAILDIGAYEYQRLAPTAGFALQPDPTQLGEARVFDANQVSDPDGDPVSLSWAFGDGATASGATASHTFGAPGTYQVTLTAQDPTGLSANATGTANVLAPAGSGLGSGDAPAAPDRPASAPTTPDGAAPVLSALKLSPKAFSARHGTKATYRLSENARLAITVERARRRGGHTVFARFGRAARAAVAGANKLTIKRTFGARKLSPGSYRVTLVATDAAGNRSKPARAKFTVKRAVR